MNDEQKLDHTAIQRAIGLSAACDLLRGRGGKKPCKKTVYTWARVGYKPRGYTGSPLILRTVVIGADVCTLPEWVEEFEAARLKMGERKPARPIMRTARQAAAAHRRVNEMLDRMGCK